MRAACQRSTSKSLTAATASIQMDLAFVSGEGEQTKDLNRVLLAPLPDATTGRISSGRKRDYGAMFRERSERPVGTTQKDAIQKSFFGFSEGFLPPPRCPRRSFAVVRVAASSYVRLRVPCPREQGACLMPSRSGVAKRAPGRLPLRGAPREKAL